MGVKETFGDLALLYNRPRTAAVFAGSPKVVCATLKASDYSKMFKEKIEEN